MCQQNYKQLPQYQGITYSAALYTSSYYSFITRPFFYFYLFICFCSFYFSELYIHFGFFFRWYFHVPLCKWKEKSGKPSIHTRLFWFSSKKVIKTLCRTFLWHIILFLWTLLHSLKELYLYYERKKNIKKFFAIWQSETNFSFKVIQSMWCFSQLYNLD